MRTTWIAVPMTLIAGGALGAGPRTALGDPDFQGTYTSDNSIGVPFEWPQQFGTRAELTADEYAQRVGANDEQIAKDKNPLPESEFSAEDPSAINASRHWLERSEKPSYATSIVVDPPDGRLPALTAEGQQRTAERRPRRGRALPASFAEERAGKTGGAASTRSGE